MISCNREKGRVISKPTSHRIILTKAGKDLLYNAEASMAGGASKCHGIAW